MSALAFHACRFLFFLYPYMMHAAAQQFPSLPPPPSSLNFAPQNFLTYLNRLIQTHRTMRFNLIRGSKRVSNKYRYVIRFLQNQAWSVELLNEKRQSFRTLIERKKERKKNVENRSINSARSPKRASLDVENLLENEERKGRRLKASCLVHLCTRLRSSDSPNGISPTSARSPSAPPPLCASALGNTACRRNIRWLKGVASRVNEQRGKSQSCFCVTIFVSLASLPTEFPSWNKNNRIIWREENHRKNL